MQSYEIDFETLNSKFDLLSLVESDLGPGRKTGNIVKFSCPFHKEKTPSFVVYLDTNSFWCFGCDLKSLEKKYRRHPNAVTWLRVKRNLSVADISSLAGDSMSLPKSEPRQPAEHSPKIGQPPPVEWQETNWKYVKRCKDALWSPKGKQALDYLVGRGLTEKTIDDFALGYDPKNNQISIPWILGLPKSKAALNGWFGADYEYYSWIYKKTYECVDPRDSVQLLWMVKLRSMGDVEKGGRYTCIKDSKKGLFNVSELDGAEIILLVEGEFDAILAHQEIGFEIGVAALGSAKGAFDFYTWGGYILPAHTILVAYDADDTGYSKADQLVTQSPRFKKILIPQLREGDKDLTDYHLAGGDIWQWIDYHITRLGIREPLHLPDVCVQTITRRPPRLYPPFIQGFAST